MAVDEVYAHFVNGCDDKFKLEDSTYLISTKMDRSSLSKMINELLNNENHISFDIFVNNERLQGTVSDVLEEKNIESETTIEILYVLSITEPTQNKLDDLNDWISGLSYDKNSDLSAICCYNGHVSVYRSKCLEKLVDFSNDNSKSSIHISTNESNNSVSQIVCGHLNGLIEVYYVNTRAKNPCINLVAINDCLTDTITSVVVDDSCKVIASGGYDKMVTLYQNVELSEDDLSNSKSNKRSLSQTKPLSQLGSLNHHSKPVTKLKFSKNTQSLLSSSMDGYVCIWDINKKSLLSSLNTGKPITCFAISPKDDHLCTGSNDGTLTMWDLRSKDSKLRLNIGEEDSYTFTKTSHSRQFERSVSDVSWNPGVNLVSSLSLDGNIILMDIRSPKFPLQVTHCEHEEESDRGTCTEWTSCNEIIYTTSSGVVNQLKYKEIST